MTAKQLRGVLDRLGLSQAGLARLLGSDERTARRWVAPAGPSQRAIPDTVAILLGLLVEGMITPQDIERVRPKRK